MDAQEQNLCLVNMPVLVLDKIMANILNPSNVAQTCKYLYEVVCGMEKRRRVMYIGVIDAKLRLNIDADAVFDSIMNSHRTINEIELSVNRLIFSSYELNGRQLERITAIMKQFGANVTSLKLEGFLLPIDFIIELLHQTLKLESLSFTRGEVMGSIKENTKKQARPGHRGRWGADRSAVCFFHMQLGHVKKRLMGTSNSPDRRKGSPANMPLQLPSLKALEIDHFPGLLDIVNLIPAGSLNSIRYRDRSTDVLTTILTKQHKVQSLTLDVHSYSDLTEFGVDHLQLETLIIESHGSDNNNHLLKHLKCQTNLKELRFIYCDLSGSAFQWICNNLKKLEVLEAKSTAINAFKMLGELKKLRHFRAYDASFLFDNGLQSSQFKNDSIEKLEFGYRAVFRCDELLTKVVNSMAHNLPNLTHLQIKFENFSALNVVLSHCPKIIHLSSYIGDAVPDQLTQQRFPNIKSLELHNTHKDEMMSQSMTSIVRAMPNLKSVSLTTGWLKFDVNTMMEFIKGSKSLEYFYVDWFELHRELSIDDVVETIRCLTDQLKGYQIVVSPSSDTADLNFHKIKYILANEHHVQDDYLHRPSFCLHKGEMKHCSISR